MTATAPPPSANAASYRAGDGLASVPPRILVADDSATIRTILSLMLGGAGYEVVTAPDGVEAIERLTESTFAVAILDVKMPRLDGFEVCRALRDDPGRRDVKVVYLTSLSSVSDKEWGLAQGADAYLIKPVEEEMLIATVRDLLQGRRVA